MNKNVDDQMQREVEDQMQENADDQLAQTERLIALLHACATEESRLRGMGVQVTELSDNGRILRGVAALGKLTRSALVRVFTPHN